MLVSLMTEETHICSFPHEFSVVSVDLTISHEQHPLHKEWGSWTYPIMFSVLSSYHTVRLGGDYVISVWRIRLVRIFGYNTSKRTITKLTVGTPIPWWPCVLWHNYDYNLWCRDSDSSNFRLFLYLNSLTKFSFETCIKIIGLKCDTCTVLGFLMVKAVAAWRRRKKVIKFMGLTGNRHS